MDRKIDKLLFVFNADSGIWSTVVDSSKKLFSINGCALCSLTHGITGEKGEWKTCKEELGVPIEYVHRDEVNDEIKRVSEGKLPCIVAVAGEHYHLLLDANALERCKGSIPDLKGKILYYATGKDLFIPGTEI